MKRALVLSGGGCLGAFEVGAIEYLIQKQGLNFDIFLGTSVGALNVSFLGQAYNFQELGQYAEILKKFWLSITGDWSIYRKNILGELVLLFRDYLYIPTGLIKIIDQYIDFNRLCGNPAKVVKIAVVATETGELRYADNRREELWADFPKYILASASMPIFFPKVSIDSNHWYDGGLRDITPLGAVFDEKPDEIVIVTNFPIRDDFSPYLGAASPTGSLNTLMRTIDILTGEINANDIQLAHEINERPECFPGRKKVPLQLIIPKNPIAEHNPLNFNPQRIRDHMQQGFIAAQKPRTL
jgi:NTE family protein